MKFIPPNDRETPLSPVWAEFGIIDFSIGRGFSSLIIEMPFE
jgi:hypothetical protein